MADKALPSPEVLRQLLRYEPETGKLFWKERGPEWFKSGGRTSSVHACKTWNRKYAGKVAVGAKKNSGHLSGPLLGLTVQAHRVALAITNNQWPSGFVDHINGVRDDNRLSNLRIVDAQGNAMNRRQSSRPKGWWSGVGVKKNGRYFAQIQKDHKNHHLGCFGCPTSAKIAYEKAKIALGFHPNHNMPILRALAEKGE